MTSVCVRESTNPEQRAVPRISNQEKLSHDARMLRAKHRVCDTCLVADQRFAKRVVDHDRKPCPNTAICIKCQNKMDDKLNFEQADQHSFGASLKPRRLFQLESGGPEHDRLPVNGAAPACPPPPQASSDKSSKQTCGLQTTAAGQLPAMDHSSPPLIRPKPIRVSKGGHMDTTNTMDECLFSRSYGCLDSSPEPSAIASFAPVVGMSCMSDRLTPQAVALSEVAVSPIPPSIDRAGVMAMDVPAWTAAVESDHLGLLSHRLDDSLHIGSKRGRGY